MSNATLTVPRAPKLPSDLEALRTMGPDSWVGKIERAAQRERVAYIQSLIVDARRNG